MNSLTSYAVATGALVFGLSSVANAQQAGSLCSLNTLRGSYVFAATGHNIVGGVAQPKAIVEVIEFQGDGTLTVGAVTVSINGSIGQVPPGGSGEYTLEGDCTGTIAFAGGPRFNIVAAPQPKTVWMIQTNPNTVFQGTATRVTP